VNRDINSSALFQKSRPTSRGGKQAEQDEPPEILQHWKHISDKEYDYEVPASLIVSEPEIPEMENDDAWSSNVPVKHDGKRDHVW
jgi:hypothetical protein